MSKRSDSNLPDHNYYLNKISQRLTTKLAKDRLIQRVTSSLISSLNVDRVVLYYFYRQWKGQVTFECFNDNKYSILGSTGADQCFTDEYAAMYLQGRVRAIDDIDSEPISQCHREFLNSIMVRANLVVPVLTYDHRLWGLLIAHHCQDIKHWSIKDIESMQAGSKILTNSPSIM